MKPRMLKDVLEGGAVTRPVLKAPEDEVLALGGEASRRSEVDYGAHDLIVLLERNIAAHHVV